MFDRKGWWRWMQHTDLTEAEMIRANDLVEDFLKQENLSLDEKGFVDIAKFASDLGFSIYSNKEMEDAFDGVVYVDEAEGKKKIAFNANRTFEQVRFIISHEVAHYIKAKMENPSKQVTFAFRDNKKEKRRTKEEQFIDYMGVSLLVPKAPFKKDVTALLDLAVSKLKAIEMLRNKYKVDSLVIERRIHELELWPV